VDNSLSAWVWLSGKIADMRLGAAGLSFSLATGISAAAAPAPDIETQDTGVSHEVTLSEEEISDVSLATFYAFDNKMLERSGVA
jgi:hypothetical protein